MNKSRLAIIYFFILAAFALIALRMLFIISTGDKVTIRNIYDHNKLGKRANIFDRNDTLLATDLKTKSLYISSVLIKDPKALALGLAGIFPDLSYSEVIKKIS